MAQVWERVERALEKRRIYMKRALQKRNIRMNCDGRETNENTLTMARVWERVERALEKRCIYIKKSPTKEKYLRRETDERKYINNGSDFGESGNSPRKEMYLREKRPTKETYSNELRRERDARNRRKNMHNCSGLGESMEAAL